MQIQVNGELRHIAEYSTISDLLVLLDVVNRRVAVELNQEIVPKSQHTSTILKQDDVLEVVHAIGGG